MSLFNSYLAELTIVVRQCVAVMGDACQTLVPDVIRFDQSADDEKITCRQSSLKIADAICNQPAAERSECHAKQRFDIAGKSRIGARRQTGRE